MLFLSITLNNRVNYKEHSKYKTYKKHMKGTDHTLYRGVKGTNHTLYRGVSYKIGGGRVSQLLLLQRGRKGFIHVEWGAENVFG